MTDHLATTGIPTEAALEALAALRSASASRPDPVRLHYLERLAQRLSNTPPVLQARLASRLHQAVAEHAQRSQDPTQTPPAYPTAPSATPSPLAELNHYLHTLSAPGLPQPPQRPVPSQPTASAPTRTRPAMRSLHRFQDTWAKIHADQQVHQALDRAPDQAGPLNSHKLVLRSLALMRDLSPDYLRRFMAQWNDLLWLEQAQAALPVKDSKPARRQRPVPRK